MEKKPFAGVIKDWAFDAGMVYGECVYHTSYKNGIERGRQMITSQITRITRVKEGVYEAETMNSIYILV